MPELSQVIDRLPDIPEIRVLQTCALRRRSRFALYGGVVRNLLLTFHAWEILPRLSLYQFVDPFADIDVLVDDYTEWPALSQTIFASLPFAKFQRWDARPREGAAQVIFEMIPVDRFTLEIDGRNGDQASLHFGALGMDVTSAWEDYRQCKHPAPFPESWKTAENRALLLIAVLKLLRYRWANPQDIYFDAALEPYIAEALDILVRDIDKPSAAFQTPPYHAAFEQLLLNILFTTLVWDKTFNLLFALGQILPDELVRSSPLIEEAMLRRRLERSEWAGAAWYRSNPRIAATAHIVYPEIIAQQSISEALSAGSAPNQPVEFAQTPGAPPSVIPWTALAVEDPEPDNCCRYRDFRFGQAVLAWRKPVDPNPRLAGESPSNYAVIASFDVPSAPNALISVPGVVNEGQSVAVRFDHGYVRTVAGRDLSFKAGLIRQEPGDES